MFEFIRDVLHALNPDSIAKTLDGLADSMENTWNKGYTDATDCLNRGEKPMELLNQARGDLMPDQYTKGWKQACEDAISFENIK